MEMDNDRDVYFAIDVTIPPPPLPSFDHRSAVVISKSRVTDLLLFQMAPRNKENSSGNRKKKVVSEEDDDEDYRRRRDRNNQVRRI